MVMSAVCLSVWLSFRIVRTIKVLVKVSWQIILTIIFQKKFWFLLFKYFLAVIFQIFFNRYFSNNFICSFLFKCVFTNHQWPHLNLFVFCCFLSFSSLLIDLFITVFIIDYRFLRVLWENFFSSRTLLNFSYVIHVLTWFHKKLKEIKNLLTCLKKIVNLIFFVWIVQSNRSVLNRNKRTAKFLFMLVCAEIFVSIEQAVEELNVLFWSVLFELLTFSCDTKNCCQNFSI